jgi:hypothetical protein
VPHVTFGHEPVAEADAAQQQWLSVAVNDLLTLRMGELSLRSGRSGKAGKKNGKNESARHLESSSYNMFDQRQSFVDVKKQINREKIHASARLVRHPYA